MKSDVATATAIMLALIGSAVESCSHEAQNRIPPYPVRIQFITSGDWVTYGGSGDTDFKYFIKDKRQPAGFTYTALTETGFGGVLLVGDILGQPRAYDLSCPVEARRDIRITVDVEKSMGVCPKCGSTYSVFELGSAISGEAAQKGYSLRQYSVNVGGGGVVYAQITN